MASWSDRLHHGLKAISATPPRLIATPNVHNAASNAARNRRASVAIILRIRPRNEDMAAAAAYSAAATPYSSRPSSPPQSAPGSASASPVVNTASLPSTSAAVDPAGVKVLDDFFEQPWVRNGMPEVMYIKRASRASDRWSAHIAFPGGRREEDDEDALYTAQRETWEEIRIDLCERNVICVGQLDDREITTSLGKRLLMILSPFVFLHMSPHCPVPELQASEVASAHWVPITHLHAPAARWGDISIDLGSRLAPRNPTIRSVLRLLIGHMHFRCILLPNEPVSVVQLSPEEERGERPDLRLWGLTLGMSLDLISHMDINKASEAASLSAPASASTSPVASRTHSRRGTGSSIFGTIPSPVGEAHAPSMASVFPRFAYPDVNLWLWVFGWRYRRLVRLWESRAGARGSYAHADRRVNWAGMAMGSFYAALRRALVVAIALRALFASASLGAFLVWSYRRTRLLILARRQAITTR